MLYAQILTTNSWAPLSGTRTEGINNMEEKSVWTRLGVIEHNVRISNYRLQAV